jgi:endoglucanase
MRVQIRLQRCDRRGEQVGSRTICKGDQIYPYPLNEQIICLLVIAHLCCLPATRVIQGYPAYLTHSLMTPLRYLVLGVSLVSTIFLVTTAEKNSPLSIEGNQLVQINASGSPVQVQLRGVDSIGALYMCLGGWSIFDNAAANTSSYIAAIKNWTADVVRLPINQDCWLGASYISSDTSGLAYQRAVVGYVERLVDSGLYVIFDLHWTRGGSPQANQQQPMPDLGTINFWTSVASSLKHLPGHVIFDLLNEPFPDDNAIDNSAAWMCWKNGGSSCGSVNYTTVGFQTLVTTVRNTGARNIIMLGGINYANDLDQWVEHMPYDSASRLVASWHSYASNFCNNELCWNLSIAPTMVTVPVIAGEIGESDCRGGYIEPLMAWLDARFTSYLAWTFMAFDCFKGPALVKDYSGTCTETYGCTYYRHISSTVHLSDEARYRLLN